MCGIVAVLPGSPPERRPDLTQFVRTLENMHVPPVNGWHKRSIGIERVRDALLTVHRVIVDPKAEHQLLAERPLAARVRSALARLVHEIDYTERRLRTPTTAAQRELISLRAVLWDLAHERMTRTDTLTDLLSNLGLGPQVVPASAASGYGAIETALRSLERIERAPPKSTGLHVWVAGPSLKRLLRNSRRYISNATLASTSPAGDGLAFSYTVTATNARPGDNIVLLREAIAGDSVLVQALSRLDTEVSVLARTHVAGCRAPRSFTPATAGRPDHYTAAVAQIERSQGRRVCRRAVTCSVDLIPR